jgi:ribonucleoside-diphosphate reductase alpha chain
MLGQVSGYRNAQVTLVSTDLEAGPILKSTSLGLEPVTALCHYQLDDGGQFRPSIPVAVPIGLTALGYSPLETDAFINGLLGTRSLRDAPAVNHASLRTNGFTDDLISQTENALLNAVDLSQVFNPWILGLENCIELLGVNVDELENPDFDLLAALGYSDGAINRANRYCFGTLVETELPYRDAAHAVVFITGATSATTIDHGNAVIRMMAAVQPMISGGIGHALSLPQSTSVADCHVLLLTGWRLGLKSLCLHRDETDHSNISNPANAGQDEIIPARPITPPLTVIQGGQSGAKTEAMAQIKTTKRITEIANNSSPVEKSQALALAHTTSALPTERTAIKEPPGKD